jgi:Sucrase/ferredoxin-like
MPLPEEYRLHDNGLQPTTVLLLPAFTIVEHVTPALAADLIKYFVNPAVTTTTPLPSGVITEMSDEENPETATETAIPTNPDISSLTPLRARPCPHAAVILLCSQRTRDARCGLSAPLLRREFERHLRMHGLYRDLNDERPGGVGIYFISHVGGHKYSANVMVYRRRNFDWYKPKGTGTADEKPGEEVEANADQEAEGATQGIWLARVRPEDCEGIVKFTILQGKVVKPQSQLRGGFNREKSLVSW